MKTIYYCTRCGKLLKNEDAQSDQYKCDCSFLRYKLSSCLIEDALYTPAMHTPRTEHGFTMDAYRYIWDKYIKIPTNKQFKQQLFTKLQNQVNAELYQSKNEIELWKKIKKLKKAKYLGETLTNEELEFLKEYDYQQNQIQFLRQQNLSKSVSCPRCGSQSISTVKQGFGVGKAVAGVIAAGPEGALAGAVGANKVLNVCQNCGHQWEPGK